MLDRLLTIPEMAEYLKCSEKALRQRIWRREIEVVKSGRNVLIRESVAQAYVETNTRKPIKRSAYR